MKLILSSCDFGNEESRKAHLDELIRRGEYNVEFLTDRDSLVYEKEQ